MIKKCIICHKDDFRKCESDKNSCFTYYIADCNNCNEIENGDWFRYNYSINISNGKRSVNRLIVAIDSLGFEINYDENYSVIFIKDKWMIYWKVKIPQIVNIDFKNSSREYLQNKIKTYLVMS